MASDFDAKAYWDGVRQRFEQHVKPRLTAEAVYGDLQKLDKRNHKRWTACCPFHEDGSPSFSIDTQKLMFKCFGCNEGGDVVSYIEKKDGLTKKEAFSRLASLAGVDPSVIFPKIARDPDKLVRALEPERQLKNMRENGLAQEMLVEKKRWHEIHEELNGLPHRIGMVDAAVSRVSEMHAIKLRELGRVSDLSKTIETLLAEKEEQEVCNGLLVRHYVAELPENKAARFRYACEYKDGELVKVRERTLVERIVPGKAEPEVLVRTEREYSDGQWQAVQPSEPARLGWERSEMEQRVVEIPGDPLRATAFFGDQMRQSVAKTRELDAALTKALAVEIARVQELMLQLPERELQRVAAAITNPEPRMEHRTVVKLPGCKELVFEHEVVMEQGRIKGIHETMTLPDGKQEQAILASQDAVSASDKHQLYVLMDSMNSQYHDQLFSDLPDAKKARDYLEKRGFSENEMREFGFGFATGREIWTGMREEGWKEQDLLACGLVSKRDENRLKPVFFSRITIPIRDDEGKLIAFGARSIIDDHDKKIPKYINSPQSPLFAKQDTLFGLDSARDAIVREKNVIVVEGYMDVIALRKAGIYNVVATMGTALSENHVEKLKRLTPDVAFSFDGDKAGKLADVRAREISKSHVGILSLSVPGKDVDEYLKGHSKDELMGIKNDRVSVPAEILSKKIEKTFREGPESVSILD